MPKWLKRSSVSTETTNSPGPQKWRIPATPFKALEREPHPDPEYGETLEREPRGNLGASRAPRRSFDLVTPSLTLERFTGFDHFHPQRRPRRASMTPQFRLKQAKRSSVSDGENSATGAGGAEHGTGLTLGPFATLEVQMWQTLEREHDMAHQCPEQRPGGS